MKNLSNFFSQNVFIYVTRVYIGEVYNMSTNISGIYQGFNKWIDNNSKLLQFNANNTPEQLSQNQEYQGQYRYPSEPLVQNRTFLVR